MPQINRRFEDERVIVVSSFGGIRKWQFAQWLPFITGQRPKIKFIIYQKQTQFLLNVVSIECDAPKQREDSLYEENYGWFTNQIKVGQKYDVVLPMLDRAGNYEYRINIKMTYKHNDEIHSINSIGKIMSTGHVPWIENVAMYLFSAILGSGLTLLIQYLIQKVR